jgi:hypothetical protein
MRNNRKAKGGKQETAITPTAESLKAGAQKWQCPTMAAALVTQEFSSGKQIRFELGDLCEELNKHVQAVHAGDLSRAEEMLIAQAHSLQTIFTALSFRANNAQYLNQFQAYMSLALKAQAQCRATLQALVEVKYPKQVQFVQQQNIGVNQQVNNDAGPSNDSLGHGNFAESSNELLEFEQGERLEFGAPQRQAQLIRRWSPWNQSTGPRTAEGKERSRVNAKRHGLRSAEWRELLLALRAQGRMLRNRSVAEATVQTHKPQLG